MYAHFSQSNQLLMDKLPTNTFCFTLKCIILQEEIGCKCHGEKSWNIFIKNLNFFYWRKNNVDILGDMGV